MQPCRLHLPATAWSLKGRSAQMTRVRLNPRGSALQTAGTSVHPERSPPAREGLVLALSLYRKGAWELCWAWGLNCMRSVFANEWRGFWFFVFAFF